MRIKKLIFSSLVVFLTLELFANDKQIVQLFDSVQKKVKSPGITETSCTTNDLNTKSIDKSIDSVRLETEFRKKVKRLGGKFFSLQKTIY